MCGHTRRDGVRNEVYSGQGVIEPCSGQDVIEPCSGQDEEGREDEEGNTEMVHTCEKKMLRGPSNKM